MVNKKRKRKEKRWSLRKGEGNGKGNEAGGNKKIRSHKSDGE